MNNTKINRLLKFRGLQFLDVVFSFQAGYHAGADENYDSRSNAAEQTVGDSVGWW